MQYSGPKNIGSIETWEPPDRSFSKHILTEGKDHSPNDGAVCVVNLTIVGGEQIDDNYLGGYKFGCDVEINIGEGDTVLSELLDKVFCSMKEGEICYVKTKVSSSGKVVSDFQMTDESAMKFNAHLKCVNRAADISELEPDELMEKAQHHKDKGSELFKFNKIDFAMKRYEKALEYLSAVKNCDSLLINLKEQYHTVKCQCYLNLAAGHLKQEAYTKAVQQCDQALELNPHNVKGLFRRGQARLKLNEYNTAMADFQQALKLEPDNKAVSNQIHTIDALIKKEKDMYRKMFS